MSLQMVRQLKMKNPSISTADYIMEHQQVILLPILIWSAYQQMLADCAYIRIVGQPAVINLMNGAFRERPSAIKAMNHASWLTLM